MTRLTASSARVRLGAIAAVLAVTLAAAPAVVPPAAAVSGNANAVYVTDSGLTVTDASGGALPSGNPFSDSNTLSLPGVTVSAGGTASVTIDQRNGTNTKLSGIDDSADVTVDPEDKQAVVLKGGLTSLTFSSMNYNSSKLGTDFSYTADGTVSLTVKGTGLDGGTTVGAIDVSNGDPLAKATVDSSGAVTFTDLPSGSYSVDLKRVPESVSEPSINATAAPNAVVVPTNLSFRNVDVDGSVTARVVVGNAGNETLTVSGVSITGGEAGAFETNVSSFSLSTRERRAVPVTFAPIKRGIHTARLELSTNDPDEETVTVELQGVGAEGNATLSPTTYDFGTVTRSTFAVANLTLRNAGRAPVVVTNLSLSGDADQFLVPDERFLVPPGESVRLPVAYRPTRSQAAEANLTVTTRDGTLTATLTGNTTRPRLEATPATVSFGQRVVGNETRRTVTVRNNGTGPVPVFGVRLAGANASAFRLPEPPGVFTLNGSGVRELAVTFAPSVPGHQTARLQLLNRAGEPAFTVRLNGTATAPEARVRPRSLTFANATLNETARRNLTISNSGDAPLAVDATVVGVSADFAVPGPNRLTVAPNASRTLPVTYTPGSRAATSATLTLSTNDPDESAISIYLSSTRATANITTNATANATQVSADVSNVDAGSEVSVGVAGDEETSRGVDVEAVSVTPERSGNFSMNVTTSPDPLSSTPNLTRRQRTDTDQFNYMNVSHTIGNANISRAQLTFRVNKSRLRARQSESGDVTVYRHANGTWQTVNATLVNETSSAYVFRATAPGLSEWSTAAQVPRINITDAAANVTAATTEDAVTIEVLLTNTGGSDGLFVTKLLLNGTVVERREVTVAPNATSLVVFERSFAAPGIYSVEVNEVFVATVDVSAAERSVAVTERTLGTGEAAGGQRAGSDDRPTAEAGDGRTGDASGTTTGPTGGSGSLSPLLSVLALLAVGVWLRRLS